MINRIMLIVFDGFGIGSYIDGESCNSLKNTIYYDRNNVEPQLNTLDKWGLNRLMHEHDNKECVACYGRTRQQSIFCDSFSAHWEMAGRVVNDGPEFLDGVPEKYILKIKNKANIEFLGNEICYEDISLLKTEILKKHQEQKKPILMTIPHKEPISTVAIAAFEDVIPFKQLRCYAMKISEVLSEDLEIGRIVAKTLVWKDGKLDWGKERADYPVFHPPGNNLLNMLQKANIRTCATGKIQGLFNGVGFTHSRISWDNNTIWEDTINFFDKLDKGIVWANLNSLDRPYGHSRNPIEWLKTLNEYDKHLTEVEKHITENDLIILTGDHGCDPTQKGVHTREWNPLLIYNPNIISHYLGDVNHVDIAETISEIFNLKISFGGKSFWNKMKFKKK